MIVYKVDLHKKQLGGFEMLEESKQYLLHILVTAGLPRDPKMVIGQPFVFESDGHVIVGIITSIGLAPTEYLTLYVTSPRFRGVPIRSLYFVYEGHDRGWHVRPTPDGDYPDKMGTLQLL